MVSGRGPMPSGSVRPDDLAEVAAGARPAIAGCMNYRRIGRRPGLVVSELALRLGSSSRVLPPDQMEATVARFIGGGGTFLDVIEGDGAKLCETKLASLSPRTREQLVLAKRVTVGDLGDGRGGSEITAAVEESLVRMNTDRFDLLSVDCGRHEVTDETLSELQRLIGAGKVRQVGLAGFSWVERPADRVALPSIPGLGIDAVRWSPLGGPFLTGVTLTAAGSPVLDGDVLAGVARAVCASPRQVALAWIREWAVAAPTTLLMSLEPTSPAQVEECLLATDLTLAPEHLEALVRGTRAAGPRALRKDERLGGTRDRDAHLAAVAAL